MSGYSCAVSRKRSRYDSTAARSSVSRAPCLRPTNRHGGPVPSTRCPAVKVKVTGRYYGQKLIRRSFPCRRTDAGTRLDRTVPSLLARGPHVIETRRRIGVFAGPGKSAEALSRGARRGEGPTCGLQKALRVGSRIYSKEQRSEVVDSVLVGLRTSRWTACDITDGK